MPYFVIDNYWLEEDGLDELDGPDENKEYDEDDDVLLFLEDILGPSNEDGEFDYTPTTDKHEWYYDEGIDPGWEYQ